MRNHGFTSGYAGSRQGLFRWCGKRTLAAWCATVLTCLSATAAVAAGGTDTYEFVPPAGWYGFTINGAANNEVRAMAVQRDGKIILAGACGTGGNTDFCVARLTVHGALDPSFVGPNGNAGGRFMIPTFGNDGAVAIALQPDGRIVLAGTCAGASFNSFCLMRLNIDGSLDNSFDGPDAAGTGGGNGDGRFLLRINASGHESLAGMSIQSDGKIVVAGACRPATRTGFCLARLLPDGRFDPGFNGPDSAGTGVGSGQGRFMLLLADGDARASALAVQTDGRIVVVGNCFSNATAQDFCVVRLMPSNGMYDLAFDGGDNISVGNANGKQLIPIYSGAAPEFATAVAIRSDGYILIGGYCWNAGNASYDFCALQLEGRSGRQILFRSVGFPAVSTPIGSGDDFANAITVQPDGKFVLSGTCQSGSVYRFCAARYHADGVLDARFDGEAGSSPGAGRLLLRSMMDDDQAAAATLQVVPNYQYDDPRLLVAGKCKLGGTTFFCVMRLTLELQSMRNCSLDIDGDGHVLPTIDGLILIRAMLGMRDNKVIQGINFPADAPRRTWGHVQSYLSRQCGFSLPPDLASQ